MNSEQIIKKVSSEQVGIHETIKNLQSGFIITGGPRDAVIGTLDMKAIFVWTSKEKAEAFIDTEELGSNNNNILEQSMEKIHDIATHLGFSFIVFNFKDKTCEEGKGKFLHIPVSILQDYLPTGASQ